MTQRFVQPCKNCLHVFSGVLLIYGDNEKNVDINTCCMQQHETYPMITNCLTF